MGIGMEQCMAASHTGWVYAAMMGIYKIKRKIIDSPYLYPIEKNMLCQALMKG
jgi:hypothetical protein